MTRRIMLFLGELSSNLSCHKLNHMPFVLQADGGLAFRAIPSTARWHCPVWLSG